MRARVQETLRRSIDATYNNNNDFDENSIYLNLFYFPGTQQGKENSRMYNEMVVLKLVQSMTKLISSPPEVFSDVIHDHFRRNGEKFFNRIKSWMKLSENDASQSAEGAGAVESSEQGKKKNFYFLKINIKFYLTRFKSTRFSVDSCFKRILLNACVGFRKFSSKTSRN